MGGIAAAIKSAHSKECEDEARANQGLVRFSVVNGINLAREGDLAGALLWYAEALRLDNAGASQEDIRTRIGSLLEQTPELRRVWFNRNPVWFAQPSPKQDRIARCNRIRPELGARRREPVDDALQ